ncbi:VWA domain-containing protein, partial [Aduncisulcus paluster]
MSRRPLIQDTSGLYDVQLAKLYLVMEERDKSKSIIDDLIEDYTMISDKSIIKEALLKLVQAYGQTTAGSSDPKLISSVDELVAVQSQGVIDEEDGNVNNRFSEYVASALKYKKIGMYISGLDISAYPEIKAYVNISGQRENILG